MGPTTDEGPAPRRWPVVPVERRPRSRPGRRSHQPVRTMTSAVITIVHDRHDHLRAQRRGLADSQVRPGWQIVLSIDDAAVTEVVQDGTGLPTIVLPMPTHAAGLPLAAARNAGARRAMAEGAETLVFLDVDCIPAPAMMAYYLAAARAVPDSLLSGPVTYLPPVPVAELAASALMRRRSPHPA